MYYIEQLLRKEKYKKKHKLNIYAILLKKVNATIPFDVILW